MTGEGGREVRADLALPTMIPCAPYIKTMCQSLRPLLPSSQDNTPQGSPVKKETVVTDVKSAISVDVIESFNDNVSVYVLDDTTTTARLNDVADVAKALGSFKPESPDVTRAAKRFEKARRGGERIEEQEERVVVCDVVEGAKERAEGDEEKERRAEEEKRGARSKTGDR